MDLNSEKKKEKVSSEVQKDEGIEKDSKRSWVVCISAVFLVGSSLGIANSFGVLFASLTQEFQESRTKIGKRVLR